MSHKKVPKLNAPDSSDVVTERFGSARLPDPGKSRKGGADFERRPEVGPDKSVRPPGPTDLPDRPPRLETSRFAFVHRSLDRDERAGARA